MSRFVSRHLRAPRRPLLLLALLCCGTTAPPAAATSPPIGRWEKLRAQDLRVARVAYRLSLANMKLCRGATARKPGFVLHSISQYEPEDRQEAARSFGLESGTGVMAVVTGSPAQRAGLEADDQLESVNGRSLIGAAAVSASPPGRAQVAAAELILAEEMAKEEVRLRVSRAGAFRELRFTGDFGCASAVELVTGAGVNAWADGDRIVLGDDLLADCGTDGDLALVIGHELAHNILRRTARRRHSSAAPTRADPDGLAGSRQEEEEADRLGVRMARAAAYDLSGALAFLVGLLAADSPGGVGETHPATARRLALLRVEIAAAVTETVS